MKKKLTTLVLSFVLVLSLAACGIGQPAESETPAVTPEPTTTQDADSTAAPETTETPAATATPAPSAMPTATPEPTALPTATPEPTAVPTATPEPTAVPTATPGPTEAPTPTPTPVPERPFVSKHPENATVNQGGSCVFEANYINAIWAVWHFVSPDGKTDVTYEAIGTIFPNMQVVNGMYSKMELSNIPLEANGWKVYCRYTNAGGYTDTNTALLTVNAAPAPTATPASNPWTETTDLSAAVQNAGVDFRPPIPEALPAGLTLDLYRSVSGIIEARYSSGTMIIRKSNTVSGTDLSGDMNVYSQTWEHGLKNVGTVRCRGNGDTVNEATFSTGGFNYSISYHPGQEGLGLTLDQINSIVQGMG